MNKRIVSAAISIAMAASLCAGVVSPAYAEANTPQYQRRSRLMEKLNRGLIAAYRVADGRNVMADEAGVYLSWRLLGDEPLETQEFDIYRNDIYIATTSGAKGTNYIDAYGTKNDTYKVVKKNASEAEVAKAQAVTPQDNHVAASSNYTTLKQSFIYTDIELERPADSEGGHYYNSGDKEGGANDASVGDLDGDGEYEIVLKWDPTNSKDAASGGTTGHTYLDGYEISEEQSGEHKYMWRIDLGPHVRSGAHENPFLVYDFDGDGKAEIASLSGPGAIDGTGRYVTEVGDTEEIRKADNTLIQRSNGKNIGPEYYTIFDGETGKALWTTDAIPLGSTDGKNWGKNTLNESQRYLAAVAYLDGRNPSIVMCRGYYYRAALRAYTWDGNEMTMQWEYDCGQSGVKADSLYRQGNHNLSVGDIDGDGRDEIVYGSAALDDDGKTVLGNTLLGHGDAMHMSDFNNDGKQEVMSVKEHEMKKCAENFRDALTGTNLHTRTLTVSSDNGRGVMDNIDDAYALAQYKAGNSAAMALSWSNGFDYIHDMTGNDLKNDDGSSKAKPAAAGNGSFDNFLVYWDGDLGRELLDANIIQKYDAANGWTTRFWGESSGYTLTDATTNNYTKRTPSLVADLWGDWREEIIMPVGKGQNDTPKLRIFTSTLPTDYRLTTLMHDCQYRLAIAWQNIAYNQPPHTSYYVGSVALATDGSGETLNYLAPAVPYTKVVYEYSPVAATGITLDKNEVSVERTKTTRLIASAEPGDAYPVEIEWKSSDESIATVEGGNIKGIADGEATITATVNGGPSVDCKVTVYSNHATGVTLSETAVDVGTGKTVKLTSTVTPDETTDKSVTWSSDNESIATVDENGVVKGIKDGTATITATTVDGGFTASCVVTVFPFVTADVTDDTEFTTTNTDSNTKITNTATSALIEHNDASDGTMVERVFKNYPNDKVKLSFRLVTGGIKGVGAADAWNWTGHEYTMGIKLLDTNGNNILNIYQPYSTKATDLMSVITGGSAQKVTDTAKSGWSNSGNVAGNIQGSAKRWVVEAEFDYKNDACTITVNGAGKDGDANSWEPQFYDGKMTQTFNLNGAKLEKLQLYTQKDGSGTIKAAPDLTELKYERTIENGPRNSIKLTGVDGKKANLSIIYQDNYDSVDLIGALYDGDGKLVELKPKTVENTPVAGDLSEAVTDFIEFDNNIDDYDLKVFMWNSLGGVTPLCVQDGKNKTE